MNHADPPFINKLRDELVAAAHRGVEQRQQRRRRRRGVLAGLVLIVVTALTLRVAEQPSSAAVLEIQKTNSAVVVNLIDAAARPDQIVGELSDKGISADVTPVPVSPSGIGKFVTIETSSSITPLNGENGYFTKFSLSGPEAPHISLRLGRKALPDEAYAQSTNAFIAGEPLHCSNIQGKTVRDVRDQIDNRHLHVVWRRVTSATTADVPAASVLNDRITMALTDKADSVIIYVSTDAMNIGPGNDDSTDCTA